MYRGLLAALLLAGCGQMPRSYEGMKPMDFGDYSYTSVDGKRWPTRALVLKDFNARYGLPPDTQVTYVELNPEGARTLVFVHGLGSYLKFWRYQLDDFARQGYRVLAIDLLGYGKSDKPATFPYTMESFAALVRAVVAAKAISRPVLVGHSMGGHTSLVYAILHPEEIGGLVLTSPAGFERFSPREKLWFTRAVSTPFVASASEGAIWGNIRANNFYRWKDAYSWLVEERVRVRESDAFASYAYANVRSIQGLLHTDFTRDNLDRVKAKTLIVYGDKDRLIPNRFMHGGHTSTVMKYGAERIARSRLVELEGCGHTVQMDCALRYNAALKTFLDGLPAAAQPARDRDSSGT